MVPTQSDDVAACEIAVVPVWNIHLGSSAHEVVLIEISSPSRVLSGFHWCVTFAGAPAVDVWR